MPKLYLRTAYNNSWRHFRKAGKSYLVLCISASREGNVTLSYDRYGSDYTIYVLGFYMVIFT